MKTARLLVVDDEQDLLELLVMRLKRNGYETDFALSAEAALPLLNSHYYDVAVFDIRLPGMDGISLLKETKAIQPDTEVLMLTGHGTVETAIDAMKNGAFDYLPKPYNLSELELIIKKALENKHLKEKNDSMRKIIRKQNEFEIIGENPKFLELLDLARRLADNQLPVLIEGESGTGKELFAKALHYWGCRAEEPFVAVNCGAIPEQLLESELFGHVKGAFTGAAQHKKGLVEAADGGTLFLDELGEMPLLLQVKLLRFLETGEFRKVGDVRERKVKARVVAATNRDMNKEVEEGRFREDLYYRLNVITISVPPLRERREDIPLLIRHFIDKAKVPGKQMGKSALNLLQAYSFPGNVRELHHLVERGLILSKGPAIEGDDLMLQARAGEKTDAGDDRLCSLEELERQHIERVLTKMGWNKMKAAEVLGISVRNLYRKIEQYQLSE